MATATGHRRDQSGAYPAFTQHMFHVGGLAPVAGGVASAVGVDVVSTGGPPFTLSVADPWTGSIGGGGSTGDVGNSIASTLFWAK